MHNRGDVGRIQTIALWSAIAVAAVVVIAGGTLVLDYTVRQMLDVPLWPVLVVVVAVSLVVTLALCVRARLDEAGAYFGAVAFVVMVDTLVVATALYGYMTAFNAWFDDSPPRMHTVEVRELGYRRGSKQTIDVDSWRTPGGRESFWAPVDRLVSKPKRVVVTTHAGYFGYEWISDVAPAK